MGKNLKMMINCVFCFNRQQKEKYVPLPCLITRGGWYEGVEILYTNGVREWVVPLGDCPAASGHKRQVFGAENQGTRVLIFSHRGLGSNKSNTWDATKMERWNDTKLVDLGSYLLDMLKPECAPSSMLVEHLCTSNPWCENWTQKEFWFKLICDPVSLSDCFCFPCPCIVVSVNLWASHGQPGHRCVWLGYPGGDRLHPEEDGGPGWWNHRHCTTVAGPGRLVGLMRHGSQEAGTNMDPIWSHEETSI